MEVKLNSDEIALLKLILSEVVVKKRTGELGIMHGANRFVSTNRPLKKSGVQALDELYSKLGFKNGCNKIDS